MAADWIVSPDALSRARQAQLLNQEELAKKSGVSVRSIRAYERSSQPVRIETLQCLAKALSVGVKEIAGLRARHASASPGPVPSPLPERTPLETLVDLERTAGITAAPVATALGTAETLTAKRLQDVLTAYALHDGARFALTGKVAGMRGIAPGEAKLLGSRGGVAARFHVLKEIAPGKEFGVTVHSADRSHTGALQRLYGAHAAILVRVLLVPGEPTDDGPGFSSFITRLTTKRPWTFVVEEVRAATAAAGPAKKAKGEGTARSGEKGSAKKDTG
jgi:transcriptional regulator with XRE-family HTH domain